MIKFKLKSKPAALYSALAGFAIQGVNLTKLQSYPEKNSFTSYFFLCDLDGHIEDSKVQKSLEELGLHCEDFHVLGVFNSDKFRGIDYHDYGKRFSYGLNTSLFSGLYYVDVFLDLGWKEISSESYIFGEIEIKEFREVPAPSLYK